MKYRVTTAPGNLTLDDMLGTESGKQRRVAVATIGAVVLSLGAWASQVSAEGDEPTEPAPTTTVAEPAPTTTVVEPAPTTTVIVAVGEPPVPPGPNTTVVAVGQPPVPAARPAPLANRPVVEVTTARVVDDAVRSLAEQLDELADLL